VGVIAVGSVDDGSGSESGDGDEIGDGIGGDGDMTGDGGVRKKKKRKKKEKEKTKDNRHSQLRLMDNRKLIFLITLGCLVVAVVLWVVALAMVDWPDSKDVKTACDSFLKSLACAPLRA
jgi:hypothetical protein